LTSRARDFSALFDLVDSPPPLRGPSPRCLFSPVLHVFIAFLPAFIFRSGFDLGFRCSPFADGPSFSSGWSGTRADGPPGLRGRSVFLRSFLVVLLALTDGPFLPVRRSAWSLQTVRGTRPDCPRGLRGQSAPPGRTVRNAWLLCSLIRFLPPSFVLPRVLQGIVPKT
jgi:hypothetical protein